MKEQNGAGKQKRWEIFTANYSLKFMKNMVLLDFQWTLNISTNKSASRAIFYNLFAYTTFSVDLFEEIGTYSRLTLQIWYYVLCMFCVCFVYGLCMFCVCFLVPEKSDSTSTVELSWVLNVFLNIWYLFKKKTYLLAGLKLECPF